MKLALGTVQFGLKYGVTNAVGQPTIPQVREILRFAASSGIGLLDTASGYGDSESVLGEALAGDADFALVTKTPDWRGTPPEDSAGAVVETLRRSLQRLRRNRVSALLVHNAEDLLSPAGPTLWRGLEEVRALGLADRIGVSIYTEDQSAAILHRHRPEIVQLPVNVLDQRLVRSGHLAHLADLGIEVHARSAFLQGTLLSEPDALAAKVAFLRAPVAAFRTAAAAASLDPVAAALAFLHSVPEITYVVVGVTALPELQEIAASYSAAATASAANWAALAVGDARAVDPRQW